MPQVFRPALDFVYEGGSITIQDGSGNTKQVIGTQPDGSVTTVDYNGTPPPASNAPSVTAIQLGIMVAWDGVLLGATPADFDHVEVHVSATTGFTPDATTLQGILRKQGSLPVAPLTAGTTYYAKLVSVNTSGIAGTASSQASGVPDSVVADDVADGIITTLKLADDAVTNAKIADTAVDANKLADNSVNAAKIVNNSVTTAEVNFTARDINGITTTVAGSAPSSPKTGDLWIDTSNGNRINQYNGTSWTAYQYGTNAIASSAITATQIANSTITTGKINFTARDINGVTTTIAGSAPSSPITGDLWIDSSNGNRVNRWSGSAWVSVQYGTNAIAAGAITAATIATNTITASQIAAGTITSNEIAADTITAGNIAANAITTSELNANAVTAAKIAANTITASQIAAGTITATEIAASTITGAKIAATTISASNIVSGTITTTQIASGTIVAGNIAAGAIGATQLAANSVIAGKIAAGVITATEIAANTITAAKIAASTITATEIASNTIVAGNLAAGSVTAAKLESSLVLGTQIVAGTPGAASVVLDSTGIASYDADGNNTTRIGSDGSAVFNGDEVTANQLNAGLIEINDPDGDGLHIYGSDATPLNSNYDFATGITSWTAFGTTTISYSSTHTYNGHNTMRSVRTTGAIAVDNSGVAVTAGTRYTASVYQYASESMPHFVQIKFYDSGSVLVGQSTATISTQFGSFVHLVSSGIAPATAVTARIRVGSTVTTAGAIYTGYAALSAANLATTLTNAAGTDPYGNSYPAGLQCPAANIAELTAGNLKHGYWTDTTDAGGRVYITNPFAVAGVHVVASLADDNNLYQCHIYGSNSTQIIIQIRRTDTGAAAASGQTVHIHWIGMI